MKSIVKLVAIAALVVPLLLAQKKKAAAAEEKTDTVHANDVASPEKTGPSDPRNGEALETPNQRRKRLAGKAATASPSKDYDFTDSINALQGTPANPPAKRLNSSPPPKTSVKKSEVPKDNQTKPPVAPSATANDAVEMSDRWKNTRDLPAEGKDGRVVFSDGAGLPTVVCAPLRLCIVELQAGERLTGEPQIGDSVRWGVEPANYGSGELTTPMIVIKPKAVGLDTNLVITTDRRAYYLRLISSSQDYVAKVSFDYPGDNGVKWANVVNKSKETSCDGGIPIVGTLDALNLIYRITGDESIRPLMVLDDGSHTYIRMNPSVLHREAPVLAVIGPDGKPEMVNYRVQGSVYVVDRLFDRGRLILGSGRKARKADIVRGSVRDERLFSQDPFRGLPNTDRRVEKAP